METINMAITLKDDDFAVIRSRIMVKEEAFTKNMPEGITQETITAVDKYRTDFLSATIDASEDMVADVLIKEDGSKGFNSATIMCTMGGTDCRVNIKPTEGNVVGSRIIVHTPMVSGDSNVMDATRNLTSSMTKRLKALEEALED